MLREMRFRDLEAASRVRLSVISPLLLQQGFFFVVYSLMCVFMCTCVHINNPKMHASRCVFMHAAAWACLCSISTHLSALAYSCTHGADPTSVHTACSGHSGSTYLLPHIHTKWATAGRSSLYYSHRSGCSFTLMKSELCRLHIHKNSIFHSMHDYTKAFFLSLSFYSCKHAVEVTNLHAEALFQTDFRLYHFPA